MSKFVPSDEQLGIIEPDDSALVEAGPGRGKTATAIAAAQAWLARNPGSTRVVFTSFSNAAVSRTAEAAGLSSSSMSRRLEFRTYHGLALDVLRRYGRYAGLQRPASPLDRTEEILTAAESGWNSDDVDAYRAHLKSLATAEGRVAFDLMIDLAASLLRASPTIRQAFGDLYPFFILDEFQDARTEHWEFLKLVAGSSRVVALCDPNQMIYEKQHEAALERIRAFEEWKGVKAIKWTGKNYRCAVPAIPRFAEALLSATSDPPSGKEGVQVYSCHRKQRRSAMATLWADVKRRASTESTVAFIVPSKSVARELAAELRSPPKGAVAPIPIRARLESDEVVADSYELVACAAADYVEDASESRRAKLAISLSMLAKHWSRKEGGRKLIDKLLKLLGPKSRAKSPLREFLSTAKPAAWSSFADGLLDALEQESDFRTTAIAIRQQGIPMPDEPKKAGEGRLEHLRKTRSALGFAGDVPPKAKTTILSMYRCKGREFDFVAFIVDPRSETQKTSLGELRRLYYVAATRARRWLGIFYVPDAAGKVLEPVLKAPDPQVPEPAGSGT